MKVKPSLLLAAAASLVVAGLASVASAPASAASLTEVTNFGNNPGGMRMHVYVPDSRPANPAIVVAMHGCGGSGPGLLLGQRVRLAGRPVRVHRDLPDRDAAGRVRQLLRHLVRRGQAPRRRQRPGVDRVDGELRRSSTTAATRTGSTPPAAPPAA